MKDNRTWEFTWIDRLYKEFDPCTYYGKKEKKNRTFITDKDKLELEYDLNEVILNLIEEDNNRLSILKGSLKRIPRLDRFSRLDTGDIFLIKKFVFNYLKIINILNKETIKSFGFKDELKILFDKISLDGKKEEFTISDEYNDSLKNVRKDIRELDTCLKDIRQETLSRIKKECSLDFRFREFILIDALQTTKLKDRKDLYIEPYDNKDFIVRPIYTGKYIELSGKRDALYKEEKRLEAKVRKELSKTINSYKDELEYSIDVIKRLDITLARAEIILKYSLIRPVFNKSDIKISGARLIPLENWLKEEKLNYQCLDIDIEDRVSIIRGSNMGGKTVLLKTVGFLQILSQLGFFVPAKEFKTKIFSQVVFIGQIPSENINGLSSFGIEMNTLMENLDSQKNDVLFLIDEFARTTNSSEASALISALSWYISDKTTCFALISTHFTDIKKSDNISFYRMKGLDIQKYKEAFDDDDKKNGLRDRLRLINQFMEYVPVKEENLEKVEDALKVAKLLGVNNIIIEKANEYLRR